MKGIKSLTIFLLVLIGFFTSCYRFSDERYITFNVQPIEIGTDNSKESYQPCQEIKGAQSGEILKKVATPGGRIKVKLAEDFDFRLIMYKDSFMGSDLWTVESVVSKEANKALQEWQVKKDAYDLWINFKENYLDENGQLRVDANNVPYWQDPVPPKVDKPEDFDLSSIPHTDVVRLNSKTFRILQASVDDELIIVPSTSYKCKFTLDDEEQGVSDRIEKIAFCLNEDANDEKYIYPYELTFTDGEDLEYFQPSAKPMRIRVYVNGHETYKMYMAILRIGSNADQELKLVNEGTAQSDGYYEYLINPVKEGQDYSLDERQIIFTTILQDT